MSISCPPAPHHKSIPKIITNITTMADFPDDCLPPEGFFDSRSALFESIIKYAMQRGYAFTTGKSTTEKNGKITVTYACDRSRRQPDDERIRQGKRRTTTRMTECPFSVLAKETSNNNNWVLKHRPGVRHALHNHEPSIHPSAHPIHRQLSCTLELTALSNAGLAPKGIQTVIRESGSIATRQDIYNRIAEVRRESRQGQRPIHALANQLEGEGFWSRIQFDPESPGYVTAVLFAHPDSLTYLQAYPEVLLDCTYRQTNTACPSST